MKTYSSLKRKIQIDTTFIKQLTTSSKYQAGMAMKNSSYKSIVVALLSLIGVLPVMADVVTPGIDLPESPSPKIGGVTGQSIDPLKGFVSFRNVDLTVPGNGGKLPIVVSRIYDVERS